MTDLPSMTSSINISDFETYATNSTESHILLAAKDIISKSVSKGTPYKYKTVYEEISSMPLDYLLKHQFELKYLVDSKRWTIPEFKAANVLAEDLFKAGVNLLDLQNAGYNVQKLVSKESVELLIDLGYKYVDIKKLLVGSLTWMCYNNIKKCPGLYERLSLCGNSKFICDKVLATYLKNVQEFTVKQFCKATNMTCEEIVSLKIYTVQELQELNNMGVGLWNTGPVGLKAMHSAGYTFDDAYQLFGCFRQLFGSFRTYSDYVNAGYTLDDMVPRLKQLCQNGFRPNLGLDFRAKYGAKDVFKRGFTVDEIKLMGYTDEEIMA